MLGELLAQLPTLSSVVRSVELGGFGRAGRWRLAGGVEGGGALSK